MNNKSYSWKKTEIFGLSFIILFIIVNAIVNNDSYIALISAVCGITYTFIAGKGNPICYLFGLTGSGFYSFLSLQNLLWGQLFLYLGYYIPMQITGFFKWKRNLKENSNEIKKIRLPKIEMLILLFILLIVGIFVFYLLSNYNDKHPLLDTITAVMSIGGMYLTVRRAIEQWIFWMVVNFFSLILWIIVALSGKPVYSTIIMWAVYLFLAVYFYRDWKKELKE